MSETFTGFVTKVYEKSGTARNGRPYTLYSAKLQQKTGEVYQEFFQFGFDRPAIKEGDYIQVTGVREGSAIKVDKNSAKVSKNPPAKPAAPPAQGGGRSGGYQGGGQRDTYWQDKGKRDVEVVEPRITFISARSAAIEVAAILSKEDALPITSASGKANKAKRYEEILAIVDKLTVRFYHDALAGAKSRVLANVADEGAVNVEGDGALPDADEFDGPAAGTGNVDNNDDGFGEPVTGDDFD